MRKLIWALPIALTLTACSTSADEVTVSTACTDAITAVGEAPVDDLDAEDAAITVSTQDCKTADEYIAAVKNNPGSWFYDSADDVNENLLIRSACSKNATEPMCEDAKTNGLLD